MRLSALIVLSAALLVLCGCYWGYYRYGGYPYYSRGYYEAYDYPSAGVTYYDPYYPASYSYYGHYPYYADTYYVYPRTPRYYYTDYYPPTYYHRYDDRYYRRPRAYSSSDSTRDTSFLQKLRPSSSGSTGTSSPSRSRGSFLRKFR